MLMAILMDMPYYKNNDLCEICWANQYPYDDLPTFDIYWINTHCIELRRNREARKHKNYEPKETVF
jgi:hypothetical protein